MLLLVVCASQLVRAQTGGVADNGQTAGGGEAPIPVTPAPTPSPGGGGTAEPVGGGGGGSAVDSAPSSDQPDADNPDSAGGPTASHSDPLPVWAIIVVVVTGSLLVLFFCMKFANPRGNHFDVIVFFLAILDFGSDVWFIYTLRDNSSFPVVFKMAVAFTAIPFLLNLCALAYTIWNELSNLAFRRWLHFNFAPFTAVVLTSCTNMDAMFVLDSHVCGLSCTRAPWSDRMITWIRLLGMVTILFEDIPQSCIQIFVIASSSYQLVNIIALCSSLTTIIFGITKRILICCVWQFEKADEAAGITEADDLEAVGQRSKPNALARQQLAAGVGIAGVGHEMPIKANRFDSPVKSAPKLNLTVRNLQFDGAEVTEKDGKLDDSSMSEKSGVAYSGEPRTLQLLSSADAGNGKEWNAPPSTVPHTNSPASASQQAPLDRITSSSPALVVAPVAMATAVPHPPSVHLGQRTSGSVGGGPIAPAALFVDSSSPRPAIPPRPASTHGSPLAVRRVQGCANNSALLPAGTNAMSSRSRQTADYFSPQLPRRALHTGTPLVQFSSPPVPTRPLSSTHAFTVAARADDHSAAPSVASSQPFMTTGRPPTFTVNPADCSLDTTFPVHREFTPLPKEEAHEPAPRTLADVVLHTE